MARPSLSVPMNTINIDYFSHVRVFRVFRGLY